MSERADNLASFEPLLCVKDVAAMCSVCTKTVPRLVLKGQLPRPVIKSGKVQRWRPEDIRAHLARRANLG